MLSLRLRCCRTAAVLRHAVRLVYTECVSRLVMSLSVAVRLGLGSMALDGFRAVWFAVYCCDCGAMWDCQDLRAARACLWGNCDIFAVQASRATQSACAQGCSR
jgi:hypothetical protein